MQTKEKKLIDVQKILFGIMLISVVLFFGIGELTMPVENPTDSGKCVLFDADWERVLPDGKREKVVLPGRCEAERGEIVRLETTLDDDISYEWFCMRASQQDMKVYVGNELIKEYSTKETGFYGRNSVSAFVFFKIEKSDAGKVLAVELTSDSEYAGFLNEMYTGDKYDIVSTLIKESLVVIVVAVYMLILSSIAVVIGCILKLVYKRNVDITYLALGILLLSFAMIAESRLRQFFLPNSSIAALVGFLLTILIPYPFIVYVNRIQKVRYKKIYDMLSIVVLANFIIQTLLHMLNIWELADSMYLSYGIVFIMVITMAVTICNDIRKGRMQEYGEIIFGLIAMIVVSIWETYITFVPESPCHGGVAMSFGLMILLFMAGFKTAKDLLAVEKEKQMAIVASEAKAKFLANMSHEIRTPINTIIGMNEMILRENHDITIKEYAMSVQSASGLLLGIINDILDFSKIEAGKLDILEEEYHLSNMLKDVVYGCKVKANDKNLKFDVDIQDSLPSVLKGDKNRIRQILNNLLSNAVKYTKQGTVTFSVSSLGSENDFILCIAVKDTGIGIKEDDYDKLFDGFQRLEEKKNRNIEGTGLGLNITKQLVELMGGIIEVDSEYGKGSCFTVKIPQRVIDKKAIGKMDEAYQRDISVEEEDEKKLYAPTAEILVVDDSEMNLAVVKALLKRTGIKLTLVQSGKECLQLCKQSKFDIILMDHMMPELDGIETLHILKKDMSGINYNTDVIALTANAIIGMDEMYRNEGFSDYMSKPIEAKALEEMIYRHLPKEKLVEWDNADNENQKSLGENRVINKDTNYDVRINKTVGLMYCANNEEMYREMAEVYYKQGQKNIPKLLEYSRAHDWKNYGILVHSLKSTSMVIGATEFSERAKRLEELAKKEKKEQLLAECEPFLNEYKEILKLLEGQGYK